MVSSGCDDPESEALLGRKGARTEYSGPSPSPVVGSSAKAPPVFHADHASAVEEMTTSQRLRIDSSAILLGDALDDRWEERPRMVDSPETYYLFIVHRVTSYLPSWASVALVVCTIMGKPGWCLNVTKCKLACYPTMLDESKMW